MQPLGLTAAQLRDYHALLQSPHDFTIDVDVLHMDERHRGSLSAEFIDGQVNIQRDGTIKRTATLSFYDPDHSLNLDADSPYEGAVFADRMVRVRHTVNLPGVGDVESVPFVGPVVKVSRAGDILNVELQDKTLLAVEGTRPKTVKKGRNAVAAIEELMRDCTGERRFRFPKNHKARLKRSYTVGWKSESSPWVVCQKIARSIGMQLFYACDGALVLRRRPKGAVFRFADGGALTSAPPSAEYDLTSVRNIVRVTGRRKVSKKKTVKFTEVAKPHPRHPMSPTRLGRNGSPRFLPLLVDDSGVKKAKVAQQRARDELARALPIGVNVTFEAVPVFHLDYSDPVRLVTEFGAVTVPFVSGSIPLGTSGDASVGHQRRVSRPRRR